MMIELTLNSSESYVASSKDIDVNSTKKYQITSKVKGIEGKAYCAYFGAVIFDKNDKEITRRVSWLDDFSGNSYQPNLIFSIPNEGKKIKVIYRINNETPIYSRCHLMICEPDEVLVSEVDANTEENYKLVKDYSLPRNKELSEKEEEILEKNLVWIIAPPRSGTSWLGTQLLSYQTLSMNEPLIGLHLGMRQPRIRDRIVRQIDLFNDEPDYFFSKQYNETWKFYLRKLILNRIHAQFQDLSKKIIIKEPNGSIGIDIIFQCLPNSKLIFLIRDGRDATDSKIASFHKDSWATKNYGFTPISSEERLSELKYQAELWVRLMEILEQVYNNHQKELRLSIKYEVLLTNTFEELKRIYDFLQIDIPENELKTIVNKYSFENIPPEDIGKTKVTRSASPGKWKENFNVEEQAIIEKILYKTLKRLGYKI